MQSFVIKVIYERQDSGTPEVRRFTVPSDTTPSYTFINEKLMQVFPHLEADKFKLCWTDEDGDLVTFSSQEELKDALGSARDSVVKIVVREHNVAKRAEGVTSLAANNLTRTRAFENEAAGFGGNRVMNMEGVQSRNFRRQVRWAGKGPQRGRTDDVEGVPDGDVNATRTPNDAQVRRNYNSTGESGQDVCRNGRRWKLHASSGDSGAEVCSVNGWRHRRRQRRSDPTADEDSTTDEVIPMPARSGWRRQWELGERRQGDGAERHRGRWRRQVMQGERRLQQQNASLNSCGQRWRRQLMQGHRLQQQNAIGGTPPENFCGQRLEDARFQRDETTRECEGPWRRRMMQDETPCHHDVTARKCSKPWRRRTMQGDGITKEDLSLSPHWRSIQAGRASKYAMSRRAFTEQYPGCLGTRKSFLAGCGGFQAACYYGAGQQQRQREASRKMWRLSNEAVFRRFSRRINMTEDERCPNDKYADGSFASCQRRRVRCMSFPRNMPGCKHANEGRCMKNCRVRVCDDEAESRDKNSSDTTQRGNKWQRACARIIRQRCRLQMMMGDTPNFKTSDDDSCRVELDRFPRKTLTNSHGHNRRHGICDQMNQGMRKCMLKDRMNRSHRRGPTFQIHRLRTVRRMRRLRYLLSLYRFHRNQRSGMQGQRRRVMKTCRDGLRLHRPGTGPKVGGICGVRGHRGAYLIGMGTHLADTVTGPPTYPDKFSMGDKSTNLKKHDRMITCPARGKSWGRQKGCYRRFRRKMRSNCGKYEERMTCQENDNCNGPEDAGTQTPYKLTFHEKRALLLMKRILQNERRQFRMRNLLASRCGYGRWTNQPMMMMWRGRPSTRAHGSPRVLSVA
ncbi:uncharacterized protein [Haliotis asinina]|uniref:uncharacterized protein n=1 Tax=Haliotis asinina TaxID=109174 RepID=UPI003531B0E4